MNIFVAKLNYDTQSEDLREAFEAFGAVDSAKVITDRETGRSRGFGFVEMPDDDEAQAAIDALHDTEMDGRTIVVKKAEPRKGGGGGGRGGYNRGGGGGRYGNSSSYDRGNSNDRGGDRYSRGSDNYDSSSRRDRGNRWDDDRY